MFKILLGAAAIQGSYTERLRPIYINDLNCTGSEESVWECPHNGIERYSCNHRQDASVMCQGTYMWHRLHHFSTLSNTHVVNLTLIIFVWFISTQHKINVLRIWKMFIASQINLCFMGLCSLMHGLIKSTTSYCIPYFSVLHPVPKIHIMLKCAVWGFYVWYSTEIIGGTFLEF